MKIGTRVVIVVRNVRTLNGQHHVVSKDVRPARVMYTGKANLQRQRVRIEGSKSTGWIHPDEEGVEWARGWDGTDVKALLAVTAMEKT